MAVSILSVFIYRGSGRYLNFLQYIFWKLCAWCGWRCGGDDRCGGDGVHNLTRPSRPRAAVTRLQVAGELNIPTIRQKVSLAIVS